MKKYKYSVFRLFSESRASWPGLIWIVILTLLTALFRTACDRLLGIMVDEGVSGQVREMFVTGGILLIVLAADGVRTACYNHVVAVTTENMFLKYRMRFLDVLLYGEMQEMENKVKSGDMVSRMNSDIETLCETVAAKYGWYLRMVIEAAVALIWSLFISWQLALIYFCILPISLFILKKVSDPMQKQQKNMVVHTGSAMNTATDALRNIETVKAFSLEERMNDKFSAGVDQVVEDTVKSNKVSAKIAGVQYLFDSIQFMLLLVLAVILVERGSMTVGAVVSFIMLSNRVRKALSISDLIIRNMRKSEALCQRVYEMLDLEMESGGKALPVKEGRYVEMEKVAFSYEEGKEIFKELNIHLGKGEKIGIVGPSGSGKSTIIKLLCKFYYPTKGKLNLFGHDSREWAHGALREHLALVSQSPFLFDGTICENVAYGRDGAGRDEVEKALKDAQLWEFVEGLPEKMDTQIGEYGSKLSGGQKQRLSIARAIVKKAELIILDEPTSALDTQTEYELQEALERLLAGKSAIIIAHRLSTLRNVDYLYCLDQEGRIVEEGTYDQLMDQKGYFYKMKNLQTVGE